MIIVILDPDCLRVVDEAGLQGQVGVQLKLRHPVRPKGELTVYGVDPHIEHTHRGRKGDGLELVHKELGEVCPVVHLAVMEEGRAVAPWS
jgi:hypothetical protein